MDQKAITKSFRKVESEVKGNPFTKPLLSRDISIIVPDTSAIIDLQRMCRDYKGDIGRYSNPCLFLEDLESYTRRILIPSAIHDEILNHRNVKVNVNTYEISPGFCDFLHKVHQTSNGIFGNIKYSADSEQVGLEVHWASVLACNGNYKKQEECFSEADRELLKIVCLLENAVLGSGENSRKISLVNVLSSDEHIFKGVEFMREKCGYERIKCLRFR